MPEKPEHEPKKKPRKGPKHPDDLPPSNGNGKRCNEEEERRRLRRVMALIVGGSGRLEIHHIASQEGWGLHLRSVQDYMVKARKEINLVVDKRREDFLSDVLSRRILMFATAMQNGDVKTALAADDSFAELLGLFPPKATKADVSVSQTPKGPPLSDAEFETILARSTDE